METPFFAQAAVGIFLTRASLGAPEKKIHIG